MNSVSFYILQKEIVRHHKNDRKIKEVVGTFLRIRISMVTYLAGILLTLLLNPWFGIFCYIAVAVLWVTPSKRIEKNID